MVLRNKPGAEKNGPINVAFYIRVSTDKQAKKQDGSLDTQMDQLTKYLEYKRSSGVDWRISERFVEGESEGKRRGKSAKDTNRPTFQKMLATARAGLIDVIVITKIDRISRSVVDFMLLVEELDKYGVRVVSLRENIDLTTPAGKFQTILMIALAQHEREVISERVREKVQWRAEKGLPIGPPPIGYFMKDKMYTIHEKYSEHVLAADALYLERQSSDEVLLEFQNRGYRTPKGCIYTKPMILRMLHNLTYAAKIEYEGEVFQAQWKPLRSLETHQAIELMLKRNHEHNRSPNRQPDEYVYLLQGLVRCGVCGHKMSPKPGTGRNGVYYPYYACGNGEKSKGASCPQKYVPAEAMDRAVLEFMEKLYLKPDIVKSFAARANEFASKTVGKLKEDLERVQQQLSNVRGKVTHIAEAIADGGKAILSTVKDKMEALEAERQELESSEERLKAELWAEQSVEISVKDQIQSLNLFQDLIKKNEDKPDRIKALLPRFMDYVVWYTEEKGRGKLEVALFPDVVRFSQDVEFNGAGAPPPSEEVVSSGRLSVRPRVSDGEGDGARTRSYRQRRPASRRDIPRHFGLNDLRTGGFRERRPASWNALPRQRNSPKEVQRRRPRIGATRRALASPVGGRPCRDPRARFISRSKELKSSQ